MRKNIFAYTPVTDTNPPFLSINAETNGEITVIVRSDDDETCADIVVPVAELMAMTAAVSTHCFPLQ